MFSRVSKSWLLASAMGLLVFVGCSDELGVDTIVEPQFARGGGPSVVAANPSEAPQNVTLDIQVIGSGFDEGSQVTFLLAGQSTPKILTNSSTFVDTNTMIANITIAPDADLAFYDIEVMSIRGKKGIGSELFAVKPNPGSPGGGGGQEPSAYTLTIVDGVCGPSCSGTEGLSGISSTGLIAGTTGNEATVWDASLTAYPLGRLGGDQTYALAISPGGTKIVGEWWASGAPQMPAFWSLNGTTVVASGLLPLLPGHVSGQAREVNDAGQAVGYLSLPDYSSGAAVLWEADGTPRELGSLAGYDHAWAEAINDAGHVVGWFSSAGLPSRAVLWIVDGPGVTQVDLTPSGAESAKALDVTEVSGGVISVAGSHRTGGTSYAAVWTVDALTGSVLDVATGPQGNQGRRINANLEVASGHEVWDPVTGGVETLPVLDDRCPGQGALDINDAGVIVGIVGEHYRGNCINRLAIWTPVAP